MNTALWCAETKIKNMHGSRTIMHENCIMVRQDQEQANHNACKLHYGAPKTKISQTSGVVWNPIQEDSSEEEEEEEEEEEVEEENTAVREGVVVLGEYVAAAIREDDEDASPSDTEVCTERA